MNLPRKDISYNHMIRIISKHQKMVMMKALVCMVLDKRAELYLSYSMMCVHRLNCDAGERSKDVISD